ncbi:MAG: trypsin-like peptidase domain-containing protein, partial [SAR324 cluster bacterium]|nr:trypsin-like peptidase domain-containing protein [SAR324 cluster bacterium]
MVAFFWRIPPLFFLAFTLLLVLPVSAPAQQGDGNADDRIEDALVYLNVTSQRGDWYSPWQRSRTSRLTGSGFIIGPGLVMTNAHVVSDAKQIIVRRNGVGTPFFARVKYVAHDSDLALLEVKDRAFDEGVEPLELGSLPSLRTRVRTYGFPSGGEELSRTEGVVSRVQFITYLHSGADGHLGIQTDSAINPGNSGGPVVQGGKVIGVAFQANSNLNDVGFFIPSPVIKRFLEDIRDSRYDGYGELGIVASNLTNPAYRRFLNLPDELSGVVVDRVLPGTSAEGHIFPGDVVTAIDGVPIGFDGTIQYHGHPL